jgi:hypothetical protein
MSLKTGHVVWQLTVHAANRITSPLQQHHRLRTHGASTTEHSAQASSAQSQVATGPKARNATKAKAHNKRPGASNKTTSPMKRTKHDELISCITAATAATSTYNRMTATRRSPCRPSTTP